jgi:hypothetical protein
MIQDEISRARPFRKTLRNEISHVFCFARNKRNFAKYRLISQRFVILRNKKLSEKWKPFYQASTLFLRDLK